MMVKILVYAYATGVFSSRRFARKVEEDVAFRVLAAGNFPQHRTVCEFRRRHLADFERLFVDVVRVTGEMGLTDFGKLSIDGTKVRANAAKRKAMSYDRMKREEARLRTEIRALLARAGGVDAEEDARLGEAVRGDELPKELKWREARLAAIEAAKARLEAEQRARDRERGRKPGQDRNPRGGHPYKRAFGEPEAKAQSNFTDPKSGIVKTSSEGFQQCTNAQVAVDGKNQMIVAKVVGRGGDGSGTAATHGGRGRGNGRADAGGGACGRRLLQRSGSRRAGGTGNPRPCGAGPGRPEARCHRPRQAACNAPDGGTPGDAARPGCLRRAEVVVGSTKADGSRKFSGSVGSMCGARRRCRENGPWSALR